jgi:hypothetical protein
LKCAVFVIAAGGEAKAKEGTIIPRDRKYMNVNAAE